MSRRPGSPKSPGSGRKRGSLDAEQRKVISEKMADAILWTVDELGQGDARQYLLAYAKANPQSFFKDAVCRLMPPFLQQNTELLLSQLNQQINITGMDERELMHRVLYGLTMIADQARDVTPQSACRPDVPAEAFARPEPRWQAPHELPPSEPSLTQEEVAKLARQKAAADLIGLNPYGKADEHGLRRPSPAVEKQHTPVRLRGKGRELL